MWGQPRHVAFGEQGSAQGARTVCHSGTMSDIKGPTAATGKQQLETALQYEIVEN